ncbi:hypothetical protein D5S17_07600 [Pseudonocardiaceae bacterium YIM PH 21723]|nr:hypothetical protein D5S17_07600 [Pseudonocardiaceae bacterium YIM PH 21723]
MIDGFLTRQKRDRYRYLLDRDGFADGLLWSDIDERWRIPLSFKGFKREGFLDHAETVLREHGAPDECYAISDIGEINGLLLPLHEALDLTIGWTEGGTVLSCVPGKLAYFEHEGPEGAYLLVRS